MKTAFCKINEKIMFVRDSIIKISGGYHFHVKQ